MLVSQLFLPHDGRISLHLVHSVAEVRDKSGLSDAHMLFKELGGWPLLDNSTQVVWTPQTLVRLKKLGLQSNGLLNISLDTSSTNIKYTVSL